MAMCGDEKNLKTISRMESAYTQCIACATEIMWKRKKRYTYRAKEHSFAFTIFN